MCGQAYQKFDFVLHGASFTDFVSDISVVKSLSTALICERNVFLGLRINISCYQQMLLEPGTQKTYDWFFKSQVQPCDRQVSDGPGGLWIPTHSSWANGYGSIHRGGTRKLQSCNVIFGFAVFLSCLWLHYYLSSNSCCNCNWLTLPWIILQLTNAVLEQQIGSMSPSTYLY